jgi:hypothetical protein
MSVGWWRGGINGRGYIAELEWSEWTYKGTEAVVEVGWKRVVEKSHSCRR